ncbi:MAG TPA: fibronectin type III domain-containing protein [Casimicrobiaceae bacterium]|nr:fibronectin type III domain-containing protein [Casimicrobiaceae bacterium]
MNRRPTAALCVVAAAVSLAASAAAAPLPPLDGFNVDLSATSVSGISSGGYMANQFHVAHSSIVIGAGILAAGPFYCAKGNVATALTDCTTPSALNPPDVGYSIRVTDDYASRAAIDATAHLGRSKVWLFSGTLDATVYPIVVDRLHEYYRHYVPSANIVYDKSVSAAHAMVTENYGHPCTYQGDGNRPDDVFINDCDYDAAGRLLAHIYGPLEPPAATLSGTIVTFDQGEFIADPVAHSMNPAGYAYVPEACDDGASCKVHVAFHGCRQQPARIGDRFYVNAGYNRWADANRLIVLYPQTIHSDLPPVYNPRGCWDWWGYDDPNYATRSGRQMLAVKTMLDRLASGHEGPMPRPASNLTAAVESDSTVRLRWNRSQGPRLAAYNVYYGTSADGPFARAGATTETSVAMSGLNSGTTYYFIVRAESRRNVESVDSNIASAVTPGLPPLLGAPTPIVALVPGP